MKPIILIIVTILISLNLLAKSNGSKTKGLYIVPSASDLVEYSRFDVEIIKPFTGYSTNEIAYIFPEILIGQESKIIELVKIPETINSWDSDLLRADCTVLGDIFSCNISLKKDVVTKLNILSLFFPKAYAQTALLSKERSLANLGKLKLSSNDTEKFSLIIEQFFSNEPAGFLTYEF